MTEERFKVLRFRMATHSQFSGEYNTVSVCEELPGLSKCVHVPYDPTNGEAHGRAYTHYKYNGKTYKSLNKLLEAI